MTISRFYISNYEDEEVASWFHNSAVTRAEIMSYKEYATLPNSVVIKEDEYGIRGRGVGGGGRRGG